MGYLIYLLKSILCLVKNLKQRLKKAPEYVIFTIEGEYSELPPPKGGFIRNLFQRPKPNLKELTKDLLRVGNDPRVKGVILRLYHFQISLGALQTLQGTLLQIKGKGKKIITWASSYDKASYFLALLADNIAIQEGGEVSSLGLKKRFLFFADALEYLGLKFDLIPISPYKSAGDSFTRNQMSKEAKDMENWILEDIYQEYLRVLMEGRGIEEERAKELMHKGPFMDKEALDLGLIDRIISQEDLPTLLGTDQICSWKEASRKIYHPPLPYPGAGVALIRVEGTIVDGESKRPPISPIPIPLLTSPRAGDLTVVQEIRKAYQNKRCKAAVLYIDSGGGSAMASEAITQALKKLAAKKPLVVSMGTVAASGGYYIATPARYIMAHPLTITGSIGVLGGKLVDQGFLEKLLLKREIISTGEGALFNDSSRPYSEEERKKVWEKIYRIYDLFLDRVATGRHMNKEDVKSIAKGQVWTGRQALKKGLVDELGDLSKAIEKACTLADLPLRAKVFEMRGDKHQLPPLGEQMFINYILEGISFYRREQVLCQLPFLEKRVGL